MAESESRLHGDLESLFIKFSCNLNIRISICDF